MTADRHNRDAPALQPAADTLAIGRWLSQLAAARRAAEERPQAPPRTLGQWMAEAMGPPQDAPPQNN